MMGEMELVQKSKINVVLQQQQQLAVTSSVVLPLKTKHLPIIIAKVDSAARSHYWQDQDKTVLDNIKNCIGPSVLLPNNDLMSSMSRGQLPISSELSTVAKTAMILSKLTSSSLISLG